MDEDKLEGVGEQQQAEPEADPCSKASAAMRQVAS